MSIDIYRLIEKVKIAWDHIPQAEHVINDLVGKLREAEQHGYLGTLYRTDFEVYGNGAFPVDMLRYVNAWPMGESDARAIEDSIEHAGGSDPFSIKLTKYHRDPQPQLAEDRWQSKFRWKVARIIETVQR